MFINFAIKGALAMDNHVIIITKRLKIYPLSDREMEEMIVSEADSEMKKAYSEMLAQSKQKPGQRIWYTAWNIQLNDGKNINVGDLCFKGLDSNGMTEIGYGIKKEHEGKGYMTEALIAMARWASQQVDVKCIEAETNPDNKVSQRVLEKAGFKLNGIMGIEGPRFVYTK